MARLHSLGVVPVAAALPAALLAGLVPCGAPGPPLPVVAAQEGWIRVAAVAVASAFLAATFLRRSGSLAAALTAAAALSFFPSCVDAVAAPGASAAVAIPVAAAAVLLAFTLAVPGRVSTILLGVVAAGAVVHGLVVTAGGGVAGLRPAASFALAAGVAAGAAAERLVLATAPGDAARRVLAVLLVCVVGTEAVFGAVRRTSWESPVGFWARAVDEAPDSPAAHGLLALAHHDAGAAERAGASLREFVRSVEAGGGRSLGDATLRKAVVDGVVRAARERLSAAGRGGGSEEARAVASAAAALLPEDPAPDHLLGEAHLREGDGVAAVRALDRAVSRPSADAAVHEAMARALLSTGDIAGALVAAHRATGLRPDEHRFAITLGEALLSADRSAEALRILRRALEESGRDAAVVRAYGDAHLRIARSRMAVSQGGRGRARRFLLAGLQEDPDHPDLKMELQRLDAERAAETPAMEALLRPGPDGTVQPDAALIYAAWLCQWGDFEAAAPVFRKLLRGRESDAQVQFYYASEFCERKETEEGYDEAVRTYRTVLALRPDHVEARNRLWQCLRILGRTESALEEARRFVAAAPAHPDASAAERFVEGR